MKKKTILGICILILCIAIIFYILLPPTDLPVEKINIVLKSELQTCKYETNENKILLVYNFQVLDGATKNNDFLQIRFGLGEREEYFIDKRYQKNEIFSAQFSISQSLNEPINYLIKYCRPAPTEYCLNITKQTLDKNMCS